MKHKIITQDKKLYDALTSLKHTNEIVLGKPVNHKAIDIILRNSKSKLITINDGDKLILKKLGSFDFDVYLRRVWR
jgi:hypothetical protein